MEFATQVWFELQRLAQQEKGPVSLADLANSAGAPQEKVELFLAAWDAAGLLRTSRNEEGTVFELLPAVPSFSQTVQQDAQTQVGNHNAMNIYNQHHVQLPVIDGVQLRTNLQRAMTTYMDWLVAHRDSQFGAPWFDAVDQAAAPLIRTLAAAEAHMADDVLVAEIEGFLPAAFQAMNLRVPLGGDEIDVAPAKIYPFAHLAYALAILSTVRQRPALLEVLIRPQVWGGGRSIGWIYLLHYLNRVQLGSALPFDRFTQSSVPTQNRILGHLAGEGGWLMEILPKFGSRPKALLGEAMLALMMFDVETAYFQNSADGTSAYKGVYTWHGEEVQGELQRFVTKAPPLRGVSNLTLDALLPQFLSKAARRFGGW